VTGIEPGDAMRAIAAANAPANSRFRAAFAHDTGLPAGSADLVLAVQAFHWMEPHATLAEVARLLRPGGVFAALDCDWPPTSGDVAADRAWAESRTRIRLHEERLAAGLTGDALRAPVDPHDRTDARLAVHTVSDTHADRRTAGGVRSWSKEAHLRHLRESDRFAWCHEVALHRTEEADASRFVGLLRSQGDHQTLVRAGLDDDLLGVTALEAAAAGAFGSGTRPILFTWRARIGIVAG
jgi:SAM-dependent methyltransferase